MEKIFITKKEWIEIFPEAREYLEQDLDYQSKKLDNLTKEFISQLNVVEKFVSQKVKWFHELVMNHFIEADIKDVESRIKVINQYLSSDQPEMPGRITDNDIANAKNYPFEKLITTKKGFAKCPFHQENTASFYINKKKNYGKCFGCGWSGDTIAYIMETEKVGFIEAVKMLK